jgi:hypothetical protein
MARAERGRCIICEQRRVLYGSICRECGDAEDETQRAHMLGLHVEAAGQEAYNQWTARSDQWSDDELRVAVREGFIREYIEKAYTAGFWQGAHSMKEIEGSDARDHEYRGNAGLQRRYSRATRVRPVTGG